MSLNHFCLDVPNLVSPMSRIVLWWSVGLLGLSHYECTVKQENNPKLDHLWVKICMHAILSYASYTRQKVMYLMSYMYCALCVLYLVSYVLCVLCLMSYVSYRRQGVMCIISYMVLVLCVLCLMCIIQDKELCVLCPYVLCVMCLIHIMCRKRLLINTTEFILLTEN